MFYIPLFDSGPSHSYTCILSCGGEPSVFPLVQSLHSSLYTDDSVICKHLLACPSPQQTRRGSEPILLQRHLQHTTTALIHVRHHWNITPLQLLSNWVNLFHKITNTTSRNFYSAPFPEVCVSPKYFQSTNKLCCRNIFKDDQWKRDATSWISSYMV